MKTQFVTDGFFWSNILQRPPSLLYAPGKRGRNGSGRIFSDAVEKNLQWTNGSKEF